MNITTTSHPSKEHQLCEKDETKSKAASTNVFIQSKPYEWSKARVLKVTKSDATVQVFDKNNVGVSIQTVCLSDYPHQRSPMQNVNVHDDLIDLPFLHEASTNFKSATIFVNLILTQNTPLFVAWSLVESTIASRELSSLHAVGSECVNCYQSVSMAVAP